MANYACIVNERINKTPIKTPSEPNSHSQAQQLAIAPAQSFNRIISAPALTRPTDILRLQRTLGNQAVGTLLARSTPRPSLAQAKLTVDTHVTPGSAGVIQRKSGLASQSNIITFTTTAREAWEDTEFKRQPLKALSTYLAKAVNDQLPVPCKIEYSASGVSRGQFDHKTWVIKFNPEEYTKRPEVTTIGQLTREEVAALVDTIYHEARHADQWFRVARVWAGRGCTASEIANGLNIPEEIATKAAIQPLSGNTTFADELVKEAEGWEAFMIGRYDERYRKLINDAVKVIARDRGLFTISFVTNREKITALSEVITNSYNDTVVLLIELRGEVRKLPDRNDIDESVIQHINKIVSSHKALDDEAKRGIQSPFSFKFDNLKKLYDAYYEALYDAYENYAHEQDAFAVGRAAANSFKT